MANVRFSTVNKKNGPGERSTHEDISQPAQSLAGKVLPSWHDAANGQLFLTRCPKIPGIRNIQSSLHPGNLSSLPGQRVKKNQDKTSSL
jgi:hypothetical protein